MSATTLTVPAEFKESFRLGTMAACKEFMGHHESNLDRFERAVTEELLLAEEADPRRITVARADVDATQAAVSGVAALCSQVFADTGDGDSLFSGDREALGEALERMVRDVLYPSLGVALAPTPIGDEAIPEARRVWAALDWALNELPQFTKVAV